MARLSSVASPILLTRGDFKVVTSVSNGKNDSRNASRIAASEYSGELEHRRAPNQVTFDRYIGAARKIDLSWRSVHERTLADQRLFALLYENQIVASKAKLATMPLTMQDQTAADRERDRQDRFARERRDADIKADNLRADQRAADQRAADRRKY